MVQDVPGETFGLRDYLRVLRRRRGPLLLAVLVVVAVALISSFLQTPVYAASAEVLLQRRGTETIFDPNTGQPNDPQRAVQTEIRIMSSQPVRQAVREKLGYSARITASPAGQTDVIKLRAEHTDAAKAAAIANAYATAYIDFRRTQAVDDVLAAVTEMQAKITDLQRQIDAAPAGASKDALVQLQSVFRSKLSELQVTASLQSGGAQLVTEAFVPTDPVRPTPIRNGVIALVLGGFFGIGIAFLLEYLDDSIKTKEDLERAAPGLSVLSTIPAVGAWKSKDEPRVVSISEPTSPASEAYRTLRTSIQFLGLDRPVRSLQVTSANAQEGKTTTLSNLGVALARAGARVVIVCCDLRRPRIHEFFGLNNTLGFTSVLLGEVALSQAVQRVPDVERLYLLASGPLPPNPSELLQSRRAADVLKHLQSEGNFLLLDSPPILPVTDGLVLSKRVDGTIVVCSAGKTARKELSRAVEMLSQVDAPIIGAVLNGVTREAGYGGYGYEYYQSDHAPSTNGNGARTARSTGGGKVNGKDSSARSKPSRRTR